MAANRCRGPKLWAGFSICPDPAKPLEYTRTPVAFQLAFPLNRFSFYCFYCSKEVSHARVNPFSI